MSQQVLDRAGHACLVVPRAKDHALQTRQNDRASTHRAGLEGYVERAIVQPPTIEFGGSFAYRENLGVSGRVLIADCSVAGGGDDRAIADNYGANGDFVALHGLAGKVERVTNVLFVHRERPFGDAECRSNDATISLQAPALSKYGR